MVAHLIASLRHIRSVVMAKLNVIIVVTLLLTMVSNTNVFEINSNAIFIPYNWGISIVIILMIVKAVIKIRRERKLF